MRFMHRYKAKDNASVWVVGWVVLLVSQSLQYPPASNSFILKWRQYVRLKHRNQTVRRILKIPEEDHVSNTQLEAAANILFFSFFYCNYSPSLSPFPKSLLQISV